MRRVMMTALAACLLVACKAGVVPATRKPAAASPAPVASATARPAATPTPLPAALAPTAASVALKLSVAVDAAYLVATGAGKIVANNGSNVLVAGGAIVSDHGGGLVSNNGGNIVSNHGAGLRLLAAEDQLPAAGMAVQARSLATGQLLAVGVDAQGQPAMQTVTGPDGQATVYLPAGTDGNVLLEATVPHVDDERASYRLVTPTTETAVVDEDTVQVSHYMRQAFAGRLAALMLEDPELLACRLRSTTNVPPETVGVLTQVTQALHDEAAAAGVRNTPDQALAVQALAYRAGDMLLARLDLGQLKLGPRAGESPAPWVGQPVLPAMVLALHDSRTRAAELLAADADAFASQPYVQAANACLAVPYTFKKASDFNSFVISAYLATDAIDAWAAAETALATVGLSQDRVRQLIAGSDAISTALAIQILTNEGGAKDAVDALIKAYDPASPVLPGEATPPPPASPCPRPLSSGFEGVCAATPTPAAR